MNTHARLIRVDAKNVQARAETSLFKKFVAEHFSNSSNALISGGGKKQGNLTNLKFPCDLSVVLQQLQTAQSRLRHRRTGKSAMLYVLQAKALKNVPGAKRGQHKGVCKVGLSANEHLNTHVHRLRQYLFHWGKGAKRSCSGCDVHFLTFSDSNTIRRLEATVKKRLRPHLAYGSEWFRVSPKTVVDTVKQVMHDQEGRFKEWTGLPNKAVIPRPTRPNVKSQRKLTF